jgi:hypothetical protein
VNEQGDSKLLYGVYVQVRKRRPYLYILHTVEKLCAQHRQVLLCCLSSHADSSAAVRLWYQNAAVLCRRCRVQNGRLKGDAKKALRGVIVVAS